VLDAARARRARECLEIVFTRREEPESDEFRWPELRDVHVVRWIRAAHVQRVARALGPHEPECRQELLGLVEARGLQPPVGKVGDFDERHACKGVAAHRTNGK
jgi:hypothetical protein